MPVPQQPSADISPATPAGVFALPSFTVPPAITCRPRLLVTLVRTRPTPAELWVRPGPPAAAVAELLTDLGATVAEGFELMTVGDSDPLTLVRATRPGAVPSWADGFAESAIAGLYLPVGRRLVPAVPPGLAPPAGCLSWLGVDRAVLNTAPTAFRPLADWWDVAAPSVRRLAPVNIPSPFTLSEPQLARAARPDPPATPQPLIGRPVPPPNPRRRLRSRLPRLASALAPAAASAGAAVPQGLHALESRLVAEAGSGSPNARAELWAELAAAYQRAGRRADQSVCWLNAAWCHPEPPAHWPRTWEGRTATVAGRETTLPVRAVWLSQIARYERDGDPLALARCRDRLLTRLACGPELDLDVPTFLRRADRATDFDAVRGWLTGVADVVRKWLAACSPGSKLAWAGLDADRMATRCYAELVLAWGAATTGDRTALDRAGEAVTTLNALKRPANTDPAVHRVAGERFVSRIRAALTGQPEPRVPSSFPADLLPVSRYAIARLVSGCESLGRRSDPPLDTPAGRLVAAAEAARSSHQPAALQALLGTAEPAEALRVAGPLFRAARGLGLVDEAARLVGTLSALKPTAGGRRDLGLAVGRYLTGDETGGDRTLGAARQRLFVTGEPDLRKRGELAVAYATAVGHAAPGLVLGRLDELFRRLGPVSAQGACGRYFALLPLRVVDAAVRAAVGDDFAPSDAVRRWLADEEWQTRRRIHADMRKVLGDDPP